MDNIENNPPALTVISGGKDEKRETNKRSGKAASGLTVKQEAFCQAMAKGLSLTDAYKAAYQSDNMKPHVVNNEAWKLSTRPDIAKRTEAIVEENRRKNSMYTERAAQKHSERIWARLWAMVDDDVTPPAVKATLLSLGAKAAGMLTDRVELETKHADAGSIEKELIERLQRLAKAG